jgi:spore germination protein YaaH
MKRYCALLICLVLLVSTAGCGGGIQKPMFKARPEVDAFYVNDPGGGTDSFPSLQSHGSDLNEISPLWYHVKPDGTIQKEVNAQALALAKQNGIKVAPLVNLIPGKDAIFSNQTAMKKCIADLTQEVKNNNYDGIDIDFEFMPGSGKNITSDKTHMTRFMKHMHAAMSNLKKETQIAVLPHVGVPVEMAGVYDYSALSPYVDKVTIMTYDHSQADSPPGPVAPFSWVEQNIATSIKQGFKPQQIYLGVATYGYDWPTGEPGGFSKPTKAIMKQVSNKGLQVQWSDQNQEPYYQYTDASGSSREVWFENAQTLATKMDLVKKYNLAGIYIWRLGFEDQQFWSKLESNWGKR